MPVCVTNPRLFVLDEATQGLAPIGRDEIWKTLAVLKDEGLAQIVIDKHLAPLLRLAERHYIIERGRIVWEGDSRSSSENARIKVTYLGV